MSAMEGDRSGKFDQIRQRAERSGRERVQVERAASRSVMYVVSLWERTLTALDKDTLLVGVRGVIENAPATATRDALIDDVLDYVTSYFHSQEAETKGIRVSPSGEDMATVFAHDFLNYLDQNPS